ncbi:MAG: hypothetical protein R3C11_11980 [Planctomycetaceae bacterium]
MSEYRYKDGTLVQAGDRILFCDWGFAGVNYPGQITMVVLPGSDLTETGMDHGIYYSVDHEDGRYDFLTEELDEHIEFVSRSAKQR